MAAQQQTEVAPRGVWPAHARRTGEPPPPSPTVAACLDARVAASGGRRWPWCARRHAHPPPNTPHAPPPLAYGLARLPFFRPSTTTGVTTHTITTFPTLSGVTTPHTALLLDSPPQPSPHPQTPPPLPSHHHHPP